MCVLQAYHGPERDQCSRVRDPGRTTVPCHVTSLGSSRHVPPPRGEERDNAFAVGIRLCDLLRRSEKTQQQALWEQFPCNPS